MAVGNPLYLEVLIGQSSINGSLVVVSLSGLITRGYIANDNLIMKDGVRDAFSYLNLGLSENAGQTQTSHAFSCFRTKYIHSKSCHELGYPMSLSHSFLSSRAVKDVQPLQNSLQPGTPSTTRLLHIIHDGLLLFRNFIMVSFFVLFFPATGIVGLSNVPNIHLLPAPFMAT